MFQFISSGGPYAYLIVILGLINLGLIITRSVQLKGDSFADGPAFESRLHSILFWGGICAVLGLLGQASGIYKALRVISQAKEISPSLVAQGMAESFTTTLLGFGVLVLSGVAWLALRSWHRRCLAGVPVSH